MRKHIIPIDDSESESDEEYDQMIKQAQKKKPVPRGSRLKTKEDVDLSRQHTEFIKHLVSERKKEAISNEIERMIKALDIVQDVIEHADSDDEDLEEDDMSKLYKHLIEDDEYNSDEEPQYIGYDYDIEEEEFPVRKPPPIKKRPTPKPMTRVPSKPVKVIPRHRMKEHEPEPTRIPSKSVKVTPRQRKKEPEPEPIRMPSKISKPKPRARAVKYKGIDHKFEQPSIGLGFKGARHLKEQAKLKEFIKERMAEQEATKKKRGRPKKVKPERTLRERKESEESFKGKKDAYSQRIDRYITNQYKNGMIQESKDPKVHERVLEYCLSKKPKRMTAKLLSEAFDHVVKGSHLRDKKGFGLYA